MTTRRRIVVGGDTTPTATAALRWAVEKASRDHDSAVVVVHAFDVAGRADLALERDLMRCSCQPPRSRSTRPCAGRLRQLEMDRWGAPPGLPAGNYRFGARCTFH